MISSQRAFSTLGCPDISASEIFSLAKRHGIGLVELRATCRSIDLPARLAIEFGKPANFAKFAAKQEARVIAIDTSLSLTGDSAARAAFLQYVPWAEALGGVRLRVFDGNAGNSEDDRNKSIDMLAWWHDLRAKNNWRSDIMIETHSSLVTSVALRTFLAAVPEKPAILWDTHHTWRIGGEAPGVTWTVIKEHTVHLHVKDSITSHLGKYDYTLPGNGEFPMNELMETILLDGYNGIVSLEWEKYWHLELPSLETALDTATANQWW